MAQISRPFQIALVCALAIFALAWFLVLHRPGGSSSPSSSSPSVASSSGASSPSASSAASGSSTGGPADTGSGHVYHGSAPGVEGLTRDIKRAHEAAAKEERVAPEPQVEGSHSPGASAAGGAAAAGSFQGAAAAGSSQGPATAGSSQGAADPTRTHAGAASSQAASDPASAPSHSQTRNPGLLASRSASKTAPLAAQRTPRAQSGSAAAAPSSSAPAMQSAVAGELAQSKVVLLLFWNPLSSDDTAVNGQVQSVAHSLRGRVAVHTALAAQVQSFGSITRDIQIYSTPTLLIVNPKGQVTTLTGYTDAYAIEQAVAEARG
jgi:hypothetical protein